MPVIAFLRTISEARWMGDAVIRTVFLRRVDVVMMLFFLCGFALFALFLLTRSVFRSEYLSMYV